MDEGPFACWERRISATEASLFCGFCGFSVKLYSWIPLRFQLLQTASLNSEAIRPEGWCCVFVLEFDFLKLWMDTLQGSLQNLAPDDLQRQRLKQEASQLFYFYFS